MTDYCAAQARSLQGREDVRDVIYGPRTPRPADVEARPPSFEQNAIEIYGLPKDWTAFMWKAVGDKETTGYTEMEGGVYKTAYASGKNKGSLNYSKPEPGTKAKVVLPCKVHAAWLLQWEVETGHCHQCHGTGRQNWGWSAAKGTRHRACDRCNETGRAPAAVVARSQRQEVPA